MILYEQLIELIKKTGLSIRQFEIKCGFSNGTITRWKNHSPNIESIIKVAQILNVSIDYLIYGNSSNTTRGTFTNKEDIFNRLIYLLENKNITIKEFERNCGLANATIRRWKDHTPNLESILKVAQQLDISIDYLVFGEAPNYQSSLVEPKRNIALTEKEFDLITMYRFLQEENRENIFSFVEMLYEKACGKRESICSTYRKENDSSAPLLKADDIA